eukprot:GAHX01001681.1.p1 GENE.GAHX01001681.1~~GAHX01001681.1.p1  ORF type:complete len:230 (-),score=31.68 GAHX01001681.1:30-719(-)
MSGNLNTSDALFTANLQVINHNTSNDSTKSTSDSLLTQQNASPRISQTLSTELSVNFTIPVKNTIFCDRCMTTLQYYGQEGIVVCCKCQKKLNPYKFGKFACFYCGKKSYIKSNWDKFRCSTCNKIVSKDDLHPAKKRQLVENYLELECPKIRKRSDSGFKIAPNPYMLFSKMKRSEIKKEHPELNFSEIGCVLGKMWNNMTVVEKDVYKALYEEHKKECDSFNSTIRM